MTILCKWIGSMVLLVSIAGAAPIPSPASAQEPTPNAAAPTGTPPVTRLGRMDPKHPLHIVGVPVIPATINGTPVAGWSDFNLVWVIDHAQPYQPPPERSAVPRIADDYELPVGEKFYPEAARAKHPGDYCVVHTAVGSSGTALNAGITHSTGSATRRKTTSASRTGITAASD